MRSALCLSALLSAISWVGPIRAASPIMNAAQVHRNLIRLDINLHFTVPSGSMVVCKAQLAPETGSPDASRSLSAPQAAAEGTAVLNGSSAVCAVEIPLCWTGNSLPSSVVLRYEVDTETLSGAPSAVLRQGVLRISLAGQAAASPTSNLSLNAIP